SLGDLEARNQLLRNDRLGDEIVHAGFHRLEKIAEPGPNRLHHEIGVRAGGASANAAAELDAVHGGHQPIGHDDAVVRHLPEPPGVDAVVDGRDLVALRGQYCRQRASGDGVVLREENPHHASAIAARCWRRYSITLWATGLTCSKNSRARSSSPARAVVSTRSSSSASSRAPIVAAAPRKTCAALATSTSLPLATAVANVATRSGARRKKVSRIEYSASSAPASRSIVRNPSRSTGGVGGDVAATGCGTGATPSDSCSTSVNSSCPLNGFVRYSVMPRARQRSRSPDSACAVRATIGSVAPRGVARIACVASKPSISGI